MRLKTKLVLAATGLTFVLVLVLSSLFVSELLRQRIEQTADANDVLAREVLLITRQAVENGLHANPPADRSDESLARAVADALRHSQALSDVMNGIIRYSPAVLDVSVTDAERRTLVSTDPDAVDKPMGQRLSLEALRYGTFVYQMKSVFGAPRVLDTTQSLERNGEPFLVVHVAVRSTFLRNLYEPWLRAALLFALAAALIAMIAAALLANLALRPLEVISSKLEKLTRAAGKVDGAAGEALGEGDSGDTVVRVARTIDLLGEQMRTKEAGYTALEANLNQVLDTLRDGVLLFTADKRAVMVSDAVAYFLNRPEEKLVGKQLEEIFDAGTALGAAVLEAFRSGEEVSAEGVTLGDGRQVQFSLDRIDDGVGGQSMGTLVTLRDTETVMQLGQELEVARRLAAIGSLTAGVGHEVKNPINAMVLHLELLRSKLKPEGEDRFNGAHRHLEVLTNEMHRLDRVVQTLADFSRPMELKLREQDLRYVVNAVVELTVAELQENGVQVAVEAPFEPVMVRVDAELIRQALLNLLLNAMQAMPGGGMIRVVLRREHPFAVLEVQDDGVGIPPEVLPRIFELYFTTKPKGSGIGLAMTYRILQLHGGALDVRSNADPAARDHGTTFTLRLPIAAGQPAETRKAVAAPASKDSSSGSPEVVAGASRKEMGERV